MFHVGLGYVLLQDCIVKTVSISVNGKRVVARVSMSKLFTQIIEKKKCDKISIKISIKISN